MTDGSTGTLAASPETEFPALSPGVFVAFTDDGGVAHDLVAERLSFLNVAGAHVCAACQDRLPLNSTIAEWAGGAGVPVESVRDDVLRALEKFRVDGLIGRDVPPPQTFPAVAPVGEVADGETTTTQAAGVSRICFRSQDADLVNLVADTLGLGTDAEPTAEFQILPQSDGQIRLITDTEWRFADSENLAGLIVTVVNDFVARTATDVVLHGAALQAPSGEIVIFPAASGSGKSTLAALLIQHGWGYLTDESVTIRTGDHAIVPYPKPIGLNPASALALGLNPSIAAASQDPGAIGGFVDVPVQAVAPDVRIVREPSTELAAIVLPTYVGIDGEASLDRLDRTEALVALVNNALNLRYVGDVGLQTLADVAGTVPVHRIAYRSSAEALNQLADLGFES